MKLSTKVSYDAPQKPLKEQISSLQSAFTALAVAFSNLYNPQVISEHISEFVSEITAKIKQIYGDGIKGYEQWGLYGWTFSPSVEYDFFKNAPTSIEEANVMRIFYIKDNFDYTVEYYYDETIDDSKTDTITATFADIIDTYTDKNINGYRLDRTENLPLTITSNPVTIIFNNSEK